jgi:hypothetical protein
MRSARGKWGLELSLSLSLHVLFSSLTKSTQMLNCADHQSPHNKGYISYFTSSLLGYASTFRQMPCPTVVS